MFQHKHLTVKSELSVLNTVQSWFRRFCTENQQTKGWLSNQTYPLNLALAEGFTNAVRHAHYEMSRDTEIDIDLNLWDDHIEIRIWDHGKPFDPNSLAEPRPGTVRLGGYGWFLLRRLADQVAYERCNDGRNCLIIRKHQICYR